jgi:hypothetical protein
MKENCKDELRKICPHILKGEVNIHEMPSVPNELIHEGKATGIMMNTVEFIVECPLCEADSE